MHRSKKSALAATADTFAGRGDPRFKTAELSAQTAIRAYLVIEITNYADVKLVVEIGRNCPIQVSVGAALILRVGIDEIVGETEHHRSFDSRRLVETVGFRG